MPPAGARFRPLTYVIGAAIAAAAGAALFSSERIVALDFHAFYCAGYALRTHADPYLAASLHACETHIATSFAFYDRSITLPAPLPPYTLAGFALLSLLPFAAAKMVWGAILAIAIYIGAIALAAFTRFSMAFICCALVPLLVAPSLALGQLVPIYCAAAFVCMAALARKSFALAGVAGILTLTEPHLGAPIALAMLVWAPKSRLAVVLAACVLAAVSIAVAGIGINVEYLREVVPAQALAEIPADGQLSFTVILHWLGAPDRLALLLGTLSYLVAIAFAFFYAPRIAMRWKDDAVFVAMPAAAAVLGSSYVHGTDVIAALPLALLFARSVPGALSTTVLFALVVPWWSAIEASDPLTQWFLLSAVCAGYVLWNRTNRPVVALVGVALCFAVLQGMHGLYRAELQAGASVAHDAVLTHSSFTESSWARAVRERYASGAAASWALRGLTWGALLAAFAGSIAAKPAATE